MTKLTLSGKIKNILEWNVPTFRNLIFINAKVLTKTISDKYFAIRAVTVTWTSRDSSTTKSMYFRKHHEFYRLACLN